MKIVEIIPSTCYYVYTDGEEWNNYRRNGKDCWEVLMGESWETIYETESIEAAFQKEFLLRGEG
jgi:hypothetical protein